MLLKSMLIMYCLIIYSVNVITAFIASTNQLIKSEYIYISNGTPNHLTVAYKTYGHNRKNHTIISKEITEIKFCVLKKYFKYTLITAITFLLNTKFCYLQLRPSDILSFIIISCICYSVLAAEAVKFSVNGVIS